MSIRQLERSQTILVQKGKSTVEKKASFKDSSRFKPVYYSLRWFMPFHRVPVTIDTSLLSQNEFFIA